eukprot:jgi/Chrzof1/3652/Cz13g03250.t1
MQAGMTNCHYWQICTAKEGGRHSSVGVWHQGTTWMHQETWNTGSGSIRFCSEVANRDCHSKAHGQNLHNKTVQTAFTRGLRELSQASDRDT